MNSLIWRIPFATLCVIEFGDGVAVQPGFEVEKYTGIWYTIAVLMDSGGLVNSNSHRQKVELFKKGDLVVHVEMPENNCKTKMTWLSRGEQPGVFKTKHSTVYVLETDYVTYAILYVDTPYQDILHLNARGSEASDEARARFHHLATTVGLPMDRTIYLTKAGLCSRPAKRRGTSQKPMPRRESRIPYLATIKGVESEKNDE